MPRNQSDEFEFRTQGRWSADGTQVWSGDDLVANCPCSNVLGEATANAQFIAATPLMFEALEQLLEWKDDGVYSDDPEYLRRVKLAENALAVARGANPTS